MSALPCMHVLTTAPIPHRCAASDGCHGDRGRAQWPNLVPVAKCGRVRLVTHGAKGV